MTDAADAPSFPPLLRGEQASGDAFDKAVARALTGADPGLVVYTGRADALQAAVVFAPEDPLERAIGAFLAAPIALGDALGALAPPEVAVHFTWPGGIKVNGADCGRCRAAAATSDLATVPDWLVLGIEMPFIPPEGVEGGETPDQTCLYAEGCAGITPPVLLESWSRHLLVWINRWTGEGLAPLHSSWRGRAWGMGEPLPEGGIFMGLDEHGGMLVKGPGGTTLRPLTEVLEH